MKTYTVESAEEFLHYLEHFEQNFNKIQLVGKMHLKGYIMPPKEKIKLLRNINDFEQVNLKTDNIDLILQYFERFEPHDLCMETFQINKLGTIYCEPVITLEEKISKIYNPFKKAKNKHITTLSRDFYAACYYTGEKKSEKTPHDKLILTYFTNN